MVSEDLILIAILQGLNFMRTRIVAFLIGNISFLYWPLSWSLNFSLNTLFSRLMTACLFLIFVLLLYKARTIFVSSSALIFFNILKKFKIPIVLVCFFLGGWFLTVLYVNHVYPVIDLEQIEGKTIEVRGYVDSIPNKTEKKLSFDFIITDRQVSHALKHIYDDSFKGKVRLNWYYADKILKSGEQWQLKIRLKKPNGLLNGGFDYEKYLYQNRIVASGYVREGHILNSSEQSSIKYFFKNYFIGLRQKVSTKIDNSLLNYPYKGLVKALTIGVRGDISPEQWQAFMHTGTNHLIAISGLHIGLMSSFVWLIVYNLWRSIHFLNLKYPATFMASIAAIISAIMYAALAGFAIPTQRALIMLSVLFIAMMSKREFLPGYILLLAFLAVVIFDPLSPLSPGFWLSFGAVAIISLTVSARLGAKSDVKSKFLQFSWLQLTIFIGLLPSLSILFHQFSLISPIANLFAVPLMSFVIVPLTLCATGLLFIVEPIGEMIFEFLKWPMDALLDLLASLSQWSNSLIYLPEPSWLVIIMAFTGSFWLLMPKGWPGRWLGIFLLIPVFFIEAEKVPQGQIQLTVLDVGQGLAMLLRTRNHVLLYDTGDKYSAQFNMADIVIIPYMKLKGIKNIDKLLVSHSDRDHSGSFIEIIKQIPVTEVLAGEAEQLSVKLSANSDKNQNLHALFSFPIKQCIIGQQWQWDDVQFKVLSPKMPLKNKQNNNRSCVLLVTTITKQTLLLTGDIEKDIEKQLIRDFPKLTADILQVPHHGSRTSSSSVFLTQLHPEIALFSYGYRNRFHHPSEKVVSRYKKMKIKLYNTSNGAIDIKRNMTNNSFSVKEYRVENRRIWHREIKSL